MITMMAACALLSLGGAAVCAMAGSPLKTLVCVAMALLFGNAVRGLARQAREERELRDLYTPYEKGKRAAAKDETKARKGGKEAARC